jgi:hypothetical protein
MKVMNGFMKNDYPQDMSSKHKSCMSGSNNIMANYCNVIPTKFHEIFKNNV